MSNFTPRDAISRAELFLNLAKTCPPEMRDHFEAFMEASIIFARTALLRAKTKYDSHPNWNIWWRRIKNDPAVDFFQNERNWIIHVASPKVGQIVRLGGPLPKFVSDLYYYENPKIPATETIEKHLNEMKKLIQYADNAFSNS